MGQKNNGELWMPKLFGNGMVLQRESKAPIWGRGPVKDELRIDFQGRQYVTWVDEEGSWRYDFEDLHAGGPFVLQVETSMGQVLVIREVWVGDVWMASGQSNMELPIERVFDDEESELIEPQVEQLYLLKIQERYDFEKEQEEIITEGWMTPDGKNLAKHSALCYFFGKEMVRELGIPIGIMNASLGGSPIEAWMKQEVMREEYSQQMIEENQRSIEAWHMDLFTRDQGIQSEVPWYQEEVVTKDWETCIVPGFFNEFLDREVGRSRDLSDTGFSGSFWLSKEIEIGEEIYLKEGTKIGLGTLVDSDWIYVNGTKIGQTDYCYPPRKYRIPEGLLRLGRNRIVLRVVVNNGKGRVTPDKELVLFQGEDKIPLEGEWKYRIGAEAKAAPEMLFINRTSGGLYNGMLAPCIPYGLKGFLWYQGETNTARPLSYQELLKKMIKSLREKWENERLPFVIVQLPGFSIDLEEMGSGWPELREAQRSCCEMEGVKMITTLDLGQYNELHPTNKKAVAKRLVRAALEKRNGELGPKLEKVLLEEKGLRLRFDCSEEGMEFRECTMRKEKEGSSNFLLVFDEEGEAGIRIHGEIEARDVFLPLEQELKERLKRAAKREICYAYENAPEGRLLFDKNGFPASPFIKVF